jgi:hypothetical protein
VYALHTSGQWCRAEGGILKRDFRKRNEEKFGDTSV